MENKDLLFSKGIVIEKKKFYFDLKENDQGKYLRITEKGSKYKNRIIVPVNGLKDFKKVLEELIVNSEEV